MSGPISLLVEAWAVSMAAKNVTKVRMVSINDGRDIGDTVFSWGTKY